MDGERLKPELNCKSSKNMYFSTLKEVLGRNRVFLRLKFEHVVHHCIFGQSCFCNRVQSRTKFMENLIIVNFSQPVESIVGGINTNLLLNRSHVSKTPIGGVCMYYIERTSMTVSYSLNSAVDAYIDGDSFLIMVEILRHITSGSGPSDTSIYGVLFIELPNKYDYNYKHCVIFFKFMGFVVLVKNEVNMVGE
ncbi:hypothetical protein AGLY_009340 [Aphis glycines]|uniref:Uncharacterized protein n=1 Tax=Aphis glycines TaxID=307491 RepID=A0A6G0TKC4_APHGL|nr:hypothetical protein AGLY_009340 [Aphis glycines]